MTDTANKSDLITENSSKFAARTCADCANPISRQSKGRCRSCAAKAMNAHPDQAERQRAGIAAYVARPEVKASLRARLRHHVETMSEEERERRREHGRHTVKTVLHRPDIVARITPEIRAAGSKKRTATMLPWCPPEYLDEYRYLKNTKLLRAADARAVIEDMIATDRRRAKSKPRTFEDQLARVAAGAQLVARPDTRRADPTFTIGGIATAAI